MIYFQDNPPEVRLFHLERFQLLLFLFIFDNRKYTGELVMTGRFLSFIAALLWSWEMFL
jgi:hypothetical protein